VPGPKPHSRSSAQRRSARLLSYFFSILVFASAAKAQQSENWQPITQADLQMKDLPADPGAAAVQLYYADFRDDVHESEFVYKRIKILNESGKRYADVEIQIPSHNLLGDLQARTIHPDRTIVSYNGKPFEKIIVRYLGEKLTAKTFTMPAVTVGSIVEYKYRLTWNRYFNDPVWIVQHDLFTLKEDFRLERYTGILDTRHPTDETHLSFVSSNLPPGATPKDTGHGVELHAENVPAFRPESYMPPQTNFRAQVQFFYGGREIESPEVFWREVGEDWYAKSEHFIGDHQMIKAASAELIALESDPEKKLRKLYARAQQTRNLTYDPSVTEEKKDAFKSNESAVDVFTRDYGSRNEIAELFTALARAAGFDAQILRASSRKERVFDPKLLSDKQLEAEIVRVKLNGSDLYLDPGTQFCPFGLVAWTYTSVPALLLDKNGGTFVVVPTAAADKAVTHRSANLHPGPDGSLEGEVTVEFKGNQALQHRLDALVRDEAGRKTDLEDELRSWLPEGSLVKLEEVQGWNSSDDPLSARFDVRLPSSLTDSGKRLLIAADLFHSPQMEAFTYTERKYPLYFPFTYEEIDKIIVSVPENYSPAALPEGQDVKLASTRFITTRSLQQNQLLATRALVVNSIYFQPDQYSSLRNFFQKLKTADDEQIVLEKR
jgi:hypothetical protein